MAPNNSRSSAIMMGIGALLIGFSPIIAKAVTLPPSLIAFYRFFLGSVCMAIYLFATKNKPNIEKLKQASPFLMGAGLMFATDLWLWHRSIFSVGAGIATLLANTQVFYLAIISLLFLKERPKWFFYPAMLLAFSGLAMVTVQVIDLKQVTDQTMGIIFGLLTGLSYAFVTLFMKKAVQIHPEGGPWIIFGISVSASFFIAMVCLIENVMGGLNGYEFMMMTLYGGGVHFLGWLLITRAMLKLPVVIVSLLLLLQPIFASLFGVIIYNEALSTFQIFGFALALIGIFFASTSRA